ncbi:allantoate permease [Purpureocillium lavendulum]|uniref:Allantoate permease n=1 Tax=Purpureocillium lavendulum TaxID=1247861 RepID=A0AB34FPL8_9HYPO|nr:allantoate permease [Purpureocillium lavendulum]
MPQDVGPQDQVNHPVPEKQPADDLMEKPIQKQQHDDSAELFAGESLSFEYTEEEATKVRWKLDLILLAMMTLSYFLSFIDKVALSNASILGLRTDNHLHGQQYSWVSGIFYFGYLIAQYPSSILMQKLPIGRYLGCMIALWGVTTTCMSATNSFATLATARFFLGVFESCLNPILTVLVGQYWTRQEQPLRACIWWAGGPLGGFTLDGIAYAVSGSGFPSSKYAQWQILFLIFGPISIAWGVFLVLALPASPMKAWFLTERERKVIKNHTGIENRTYRVYQVKECLTDIQPWAFWSLALLQCIVGSGLTNFDKIVLTGLGFDNHESSKMGFPGDGVQLFSIIATGIITLRIPNTRIITSIVSNVIVIIGSCLVSTQKANHTRLAGLYIMYVNTVTYGMVMSLVASNIGGFTKKATCSVMVFVGYATGQIIAPQFFRESESPSYPTGFRAFYVSTALMIVILVGLYIHLWRENSRRDKISTAYNPDDQADMGAFLDKTDKEQLSFRYVL